jgi:hypothetical protein
MADQLTLADVTQEQFDVAERIVIDLLRSAYPTLDQRRGTVIRDTLVRPDAALTALSQERVERLRRLISLSTMADDGTASVEDINRILANFNMQRQDGAASTGVVRVKVNAARTYTIPSGFTLSALTGLLYRTQGLTVVKTDATESLGEIQLFTGTDNSYYFLLPVTADSVGSEFNIPQGTAMEPLSQLYGFVSAIAYTNFSDGHDAESIASAISRIPAAISHRGLTNRTAIEAQLRDRFNGTAIALEAVSVLGYGDAGQLRDKHNVFGVAVGGRVDVYPRTFGLPVVRVLEKTGTRSAQGIYTFDIDVSEAPGYYAIRTITDKDSVALSSYLYTETRSASGLDQTRHDIDITDPVIETAYTVFQAATITVSGVPDNAATHVFKVELYCAPGLEAIQTYVDDPAVRNIAADLLVRSPLVCLVTCTATLYYATHESLDLVDLQRKVAAYINSRSFVSRLTRSEIVSVLLAHGVKRVDLDSAGLRLEGRIRDASGVWHTLTGDSLDLTSIQDANVLLVPETCVFAAEIQNIHLVGVAE